jgi:hypothetical protein
VSRCLPSAHAGRGCWIRLGARLANALGSALGAGGLLVAVALPAGAAPPPPPDGSLPGTLQVSPREVRPGDVVRVTGGGCRAGDRVDLTLFTPAAQPVRSLPAAGGGAFRASLRVPADAQPGRVWVRASCPGADDRSHVMDATLAVRSPGVVITGVNLLFGAGAALAVAGFGLAGRRRPARSPRSVRARRARRAGRRRVPGARPGVGTRLFGLRRRRRRRRRPPRRGPARGPRRPEMSTRR